MLDIHVYSVVASLI